MYPRPTPPKLSLGRWLGDSDTWRVDWLEEEEGADSCTTSRETLKKTCIIDIIMTTVLVQGASLRQLKYNR